MLVWTILKKYRNFIGQITTNTMCCTSLFICIMAIISNFSIIFIFSELLSVSFSAKVINFCIFVIFNSLFVNSIFFLFSKSMFLISSLKNSQNFFIQSFPWYKKYVCFLCDKMAKLLTLNFHKEYTHLFLDYFLIHLFF